MGFATPAELKAAAAETSRIAAKQLPTSRPLATGPRWLGITNYPRTHMYGRGHTPRYSHYPASLLSTGLRHIGERRAFVGHSRRIAQKLPALEDGKQPHVLGSKRCGRALLPVDQHQGRVHPRARRTHGIHRLQNRAA